MVIEQLIGTLKNEKTYADELKFIEDRFIEFKNEMNRNLDTNAEITFLSKLKQDTFVNANKLIKSGNSKEAAKFLAVSNIIHSMIYNRGVFQWQDSGLQNRQ